MSIRIKTAIQVGAVLVLTDPLEQTVVGWFKVVEFSGRTLTIMDNEGRLFRSEFTSIWLHLYFKINIPEILRSYSTKEGYKYRIEFELNDRYKVHFLDFVQRARPELLSQLPEEF